MCASITTQATQNLDRRARNYTPREMSPDGGEVTSRGAVLYRVYAKRNGDGTLSIESAGNPRAVLAFFTVIKKAAEDLAKAKAGQLKDVLGEAVRVQDYDLKLAVASLGYGTTIRIGSVMETQRGQLTILLLRSGKCELPPVPEDAVPKAVLKNAEAIAWLQANATAPAAQTVGANVPDEV